jgi:hypothetical protein
MGAAKIGAAEAWRPRKGLAAVRFCDVKLDCRDTRIFFVGCSEIGYNAFEGEIMATTWTLETRIDMFRRLRDRFGPLGQWGGGSYPAGEKRAFDDFLAELAQQLAGPTGNPRLTTGAVGNQIPWAFTNDNIRYQNHFRNMVMNTAAALEAGFI